MRFYRVFSIGSPGSGSAMRTMMALGNISTEWPRVSENGENLRSLFCHLLHERLFDIHKFCNTSFSYDSDFKRSERKNICQNGKGKTRRNVIALISLSSWRKGVLKKIKPIKLRNIFSRMKIENQVVTHWKETRLTFCQVVLGTFPHPRAFNHPSLPPLLPVRPWGVLPPPASCTPWLRTPVPMQILCSIKAKIRVFPLGFQTQDLNSFLSVKIHLQNSTAQIALRFHLRFQWQRSSIERHENARTFSLSFCRLISFPL